MSDIIRTPQLKEPEDQKTFDTPYGAFTLRRPTIRMQRDIHLLAARTLQGLQNVDQLGEMMNLMMATIEVCARNDRQNVSERPLGWPKDFAWDTAYDIDWLSDLYVKHSEWVNTFRKSSQSDSNQEGSSGRSKEQALPATEAVELGA